MPHYRSHSIVEAHIFDVASKEHGALSNWVAHGKMKYQEDGTAIVWDNAGREQIARPGDYIVNDTGSLRVLEPAAFRAAHEMVDTPAPGPQVAPLPAEPAQPDEEEQTHEGSHREGDDGSFEPVPIEQHQDHVVEDAEVVGAEHGEPVRPIGPDGHAEEHTASTDRETEAETRAAVEPPKLAETPTPVVEPQKTVEAPASEKPVTEPAPAADGHAQDGPHASISEHGDANRETHEDVARVARNAEPHNFD